MNLDAGRFLFQQRYYLYENLLGWNLYNEVLGLTNYFFLTPVIVKPRQYEKEP